ncbi:MAG: hypothetical protein ACLS3C_03745 [Oscillospiraceae bacterium]
MIGPGTVFATAGHPVNPRLRELRYVYNLPICVGRNVWIGSGVQIMPDITIGDNSVDRRRLQWSPRISPLTWWQLEIHVVFFVRSAPMTEKYFYKGFRAGFRPGIGASSSCNNLPDRRRASYCKRLPILRKALVF